MSSATADKLRWCCVLLDKIITAADAHKALDRHVEEIGKLVEWVKSVFEWCNDRDCTIAAIAP